MSVNDAQQYHTNQVHFLRKAVAFGDGVVSMGWLPSNASVIGAGVVVSTAFNAGTTNTYDMGFRNAGDGTADDVDEFATAVATGTAGLKVADELATAGDLTFPEGAEAVVTVNGTGTAATAGAGVAYISYVVDNT